jgi:NADH dehydrogenase (ubiquinone) 1 alpha subcomplex subunit 7
MATGRLPGTPGKIISFIRDFLIGRESAAIPWLRTVDECSTRSPPPAHLPDGVAHRLSANYYYSRDTRKEVAPPTISYPTHKLLADQDNGSPLTLPPRPVNQ